MSLNRSLLCPARWACLVLTCLLALGIELRAQQRDDERIAQLKEQITAAEGVVQAAKNASEKTRLEARLQRLREELAILEARQAIEARQRALTSTFQRRPIDALREQLRTIDVTVEEAEKRVKELAEKRRAATAARDGLEEQIKTLTAAGQAEQNSLRIADLSEQIYTRNEELRALALQREATEFEIDLAREADRLRERVKTLDSSGRPTAKALFEMYTEIGAARKAADQLSPRLANLEQNLKISESALALTQQKLAKFDEELALLEKQTGFFSSNARLERLLAAQRTQKKAIGERLVFVTAQVDALKRSVEAVTTTRALGTLALQVIEEHYTVLKDGYLERLRWPGAVLLALVALYLVLAIIVLPIFYKKESLFLARRLARYVTIVLAVGAVASFMFDDLSMVAATMGIVSAALVIALQDVCTSAFGWFVIMMGSKFGIGDRLELEETKGDVIDIQLLRTTLLEVNGWLGVDEPTGRVILVPNNFIFTQKIFNYSHGHPYIWGKIEVTVGFSCAEAAAAVFQRVLQEETKDEFAAARQAALRMQRRYGVEDAVYEPRVTSRISGNDVAFSLFFVAHFRRAAELRDRIDHRLIEELTRRPDIQLAVTSLQVSSGDPPFPPPPAALPAGSRVMSAGELKTG